MNEQIGNFNGMTIEQIRNSDWIRIEQIINKFHLLFE